MTSVDYEHISAIARKAAREEVASLCGLVLRRTQDLHLTRSNEHNMVDAQIHEELAEIFGEALQQFTDDGDAKAEGA